VIHTALSSSTYHGTIRTLPMMYADQHDSFNAVSDCYFSITVHPSSHFSVETPSTSPQSEYSAHTRADPLNPLLAARHLSEAMSSPADASRLLQLQTQAAHRPSAEPLQRPDRNSVSPSNSSDSSDSSRSASSNSRASTKSPQLCCCRCRRESLAGMFQFGQNNHYCSHCARMVGYSAG
jgi:hypothetical protein